MCLPSACLYICYICICTAAVSAVSLLQFFLIFCSSLLLCVTCIFHWFHPWIGGTVGQADRDRARWLRGELLNRYVRERAAGGYRESPFWPVGFEPELTFAIAIPISIPWPRLSTPLQPM